MQQIAMKGLFGLVLPHQVCRVWHSSMWKHRQLERNRCLRTFCHPAQNSSGQCVNQSHLTVESDPPQPRHGASVEKEDFGVMPNWSVFTVWLAPFWLCGRRVVSTRWLACQQAYKATKQSIESCAYGKYYFQIFSNFHDGFQCRLQNPNGQITPLLRETDATALTY